MTEATAVIARGIGKPGLRYEQLTYDQVRQGCWTQAGHDAEESRRLHRDVPGPSTPGVLAAQEPRSPGQQHTDFV